MTHTKKKLIEVALPLDAINIASAREKSIHHGHPSTLISGERGVSYPIQRVCGSISSNTPHSHHRIQP